MYYNEVTRSSSNFRLSVDRFLPVDHIAGCYLNGLNTLRPWRLLSAMDTLCHHLYQDSIIYYTGSSNLYRIVRIYPTYLCLMPKGRRPSIGSGTIRTSEQTFPRLAPCSQYSCEKIEPHCHTTSLRIRCDWLPRRFSAKSVSCFYGFVWYVLWHVCDTLLFLPFYASCVKFFH